MEEYKRIYNGMKYAEVVEVIGGTGKTLSSIDIGDPQYKTEVIQWEGEGFAGSNATIEFQGGKVVGKTGKQTKLFFKRTQGGFAFYDAVAHTRTGKPGDLCDL